VTLTTSGSRTLTATYGGNSSFNGSNGTESHVVTTPPPPNQAPTAAFSFSCPANGCDFTDESTDDHPPVASWAWDFGDPTSADNTSTNQNPSHFYALAGTYTVTLTATDGQGLASTTPASQSFTIANDASAPAPKN
jgi:PKD repeat protein